jgi:hypothetical protein
MIHPRLYGFDIARDIAVIAAEGVHLIDAGSHDAGYRVTDQSLPTV